MKLVQYTLVHSEGRGQHSAFGQGVLRSYSLQRDYRTFSPLSLFNPLTPNDPYSGRTAPLSSKRCILYIYSTNIGREYFKHGIYSPYFFYLKCSLCHNSNVFGSCFIHILYTECAKI